MDGVHDMGGAEGFGRVVTKPDEPVWHAEWEKSVFAIYPFGFAAGWYGIDSARHGVEKMPALAYLTSTYYEHWLHSFELHGKRAGAIDAAELDERTRHFHENPEAPLPEDRNPGLAEFVSAAVAGGVTARREAPAAPRFAVGDRVRVRDDSPRGHTRRPRYIRGRTGEIVALRGAFVYPDSAGNGGGEDPQHLYALQFTGADLWGDGNADPNLTVCVDAFEPYLEPAGGER